MKTVFGVLFMGFGVSAVLYGFAITGPPVGEALNQAVFQLATAYSAYRAENPITTGVGFLAAGATFFLISAAIFRNKKGESPAATLNGVSEGRR